MLFSTSLFLCTKFYAPCLTFLLFIGDFVVVLGAVIRQVSKCNYSQVHDGTCADLCEKVRCLVRQLHLVIGIHLSVGPSVCFVLFCLCKSSSV